MLLSVVDSFPDDWKVKVTVTEGGKDARGNPLPPNPVDVPNCVVSYGPTSDPADNSQVPNSSPILYGPVGMPLRSTSKVRIPEGCVVATPGLYVVNGDVMRYPLGTVANLKKG